MHYLVVIACVVSPEDVELGTVVVAALRSHTQALQSFGVDHELSLQCGVRVCVAVHKKLTFAPLDLVSAAYADWKKH